MGKVSHYPTSSKKYMPNPYDSATTWETPEEALNEIFIDLNGNISSCEKCGVDEENWIWIKHDNF